MAIHKLFSTILYIQTRGASVQSYYTCCVSISCQFILYLSYKQQMAFSLYGYAGGSVKLLFPYYTSNARTRLECFKHTYDHFANCSLVYKRDTCTTVTEHAMSFAINFEKPLH